MQLWMKMTKLITTSVGAAHSWLAPAAHFATGVVPVRRRALLQSAFLTSSLSTSPDVRNETHFPPVSHSRPSGFAARKYETDINGGLIFWTTIDLLEMLLAALRPSAQRCLLIHERHWQSCVDGCRSETTAGGGLRSATTTNGVRRFKTTISCWLQYCDRHYWWSQMCEHHVAVVANLRPPKTVGRDCASANLFEPRCSDVYDQHICGGLKYKTTIFSPPWWSQMLDHQYCRSNYLDSQNKLAFGPCPSRSRA